MPRTVTLRGPVYTFTCYGIHEAKQAGLIDSWEREGTHAPISTIFEHGEGKLLADWITHVPDALLVATGRYQITVYRPKSRLILLPEDEAEGHAGGPLLELDAETPGEMSALPASEVETHHEIVIPLRETPLCAIA
jgi:hypothetical protein